jgi:hypothetical protein
MAKNTSKAKPAAKAPKAKKAAASKKAAAAQDEDHEGKAADKHIENVLQEMTAVPERPHVDQWSQVECPYCGENFEVHVTSEDDGANMSEDCQVCSRSISLHVHFEEDDLQVSAYRS